MQYPGVHSSTFQYYPGNKFTVHSCIISTKFSIAVEPGPCIDFSPELGMQVATIDSRSFLASAWRGRHRTVVKAKIGSDPFIYNFFYTMVQYSVVQSSSTLDGRGRCRGTRVRATTSTKFSTTAAQCVHWSSALSTRVYTTKFSTFESTCNLQ
jgi:hypothetical protein